MYFVYIVECADGTLYTGITTDVARRMEEHRRGVASRYTRARKFHSLRYQENCPDRSVATAREVQIKRLSRSAKLRLIRNSQKSK